MALQRYLLRAAVLVAVGFVIAAASPAGAQQTTYRINGHVICSGTEANPIPVPGVTVAVIDSTFTIATTVTDANGFYSFAHTTDEPRSCVVWLPNQALAPSGDTTALPTPPARITTLAEFNITSFFLPGRVDAPMDETMYLGKDTNETDFFDNDFAVNCPVTTIVDGHVFCKDSEPTVFLEGVTVAVINRDFVIDTTVTDANGYYRFEHTGFEARDCIIWLPQQPLVTPGMTWPFPSPPAIVTNISLSNLGPLFQPGRIEAELGETIFVGKNFGTTIFLDNDFSVPCPPCNPVVLEPIADQIAVEGDLFTGQQPVVTSGTTPITWILQSGPIGMTIDPATGIVSWMAAFNSAPSVAVTIIADNGCPDEVTSQVTFNVVECIPPVIASLPDVDLAEGEPFTSVQPVLTQGSGTIVFELVQGPIGMTIDPATGIVMWTATFEDIGAQEVIIIRAVNDCPDQGGFISSQTFTITECTPPVIAPLPDVELAEGQMFTSVQPTLTQGSGTIAFELVEGPAGMTIDPATGIVSWTATFPEPTEPISIVIRAVNGCPDQGGFVSSQTFIITECTPPVIAPLPDVVLTEGEVFTSAQPVVTQGSGSITFELAQGPAGMTIDPATGIVSWTAAFADPTEPISIVIRAVNGCPDQGGFISTQTFIVTECTAPAVDPIEDDFAFEDMAYTGPVPELSPETTQPATWEIMMGPEGMTVDPETGQVSWPMPVVESAPAMIVLRVTNSCGSAEVGFNIFDGNCIYTTERDENYAQLGEAGVVDYLRGVLAGEGSVFVEEGRGLCMQVPQLGDNILFWASPHQYVPLIDRTVYRACIEASFDRPDPDTNTIPLWTFWYDNWDPCDLGNIYGGEHWFADVMGGASGIDRAQGRSKFEVWFSPIPVETAQWRGTIEEDVINAFHPSVDNLNDFRYGFKVVDIGSGNMGANLDFGTICIESITIQSLPIDCLKLDATLYDVPLSPETHAAFAIGETPLFAEIGQDGVARFNLSTGNDRATLFPLTPTEERAEIFPALNVIGLYPVLWESDTLYRIRTEIQSGAGSSETDPIDAILVNYDTVTNEQGGMHYAVRGMPASPNFQDNFFRAGSPRDAAMTGGQPQTYTQFFYSNNTTADPRIGADRMRGFVQLINRTDLYTEQSGTDPLEILSLAVDRMIAPPQMPSGETVSGN